MNPVMLSEGTKKLLSDFRHEYEEEIICASKGKRKFASWDKTIQFMYKLAIGRVKK
jgi:hypothetical protein